MQQSLCGCIQFGPLLNAKLTQLKKIVSVLLSAESAICRIFTESAPLGRFSHWVAMSVCLSVCDNSNHPLPAVQEDLWSKGVLLILACEDTFFSMIFCTFQLFFAHSHFFYPSPPPQKKKKISPPNPRKITNIKFKKMDPPPISFRTSQQKIIFHPNLFFLLLFFDPPNNFFGPPLKKHFAPLKNKNNKTLVLLPALVKWFSVSRMRDFFVPDSSFKRLSLRHLKIARLL